MIAWEISTAVAVKRSAGFEGRDYLLKTEPIYDEKWDRRGQHQDDESQGPRTPPGL